jgi:hypothetical protein
MAQVSAAWVAAGGLAGVLIGGFVSFLLQRGNLEYQTRASLRAIYTHVLITQRRSREASLALARAGGRAESGLLEAAEQAHAEFMDSYHELNLDSNEAMWRAARTLLGVLTEMLNQAKAGEVAACLDLADVARNARRNLEGSFRRRFRHQSLQPHKPIPARFVDMPEPVPLEGRHPDTASEQPTGEAADR